MAPNKLRREIGTEGLANLERLKTKYSNEIPETFVHSTSPDPYFKIRKAWFTSVGTTVSALENVGLLPAEGAVMEAVTGFRTNVRDVLGNSTVHPEKKHIDQTDATIDAVIAYLKEVLAEDAKTRPPKKPRGKKK